MEKENKKNLLLAISLLVIFLLWTLVIKFIDVQAIGPRESVVGLATINQFIHNHMGINMSLYIITDWLGLVPIIFGIGFGLLGLIQWIKRKHIKYVDYSILVLGGFYIVVIAVYILFEICIINYRPLLINGYLEPSYPSSTTMLVMCVMPTTIMQLNTYIKNKIFKMCIFSLINIFILFMVIGRLISGVHWFTDIIGGTILSTGLVLMYYTIINFKIK